MPRTGSGTYNLPAGNPVVTGTAISSTVQNSTMSDIATALTQSIAKDGQTTPSANLPMGGYKHTGVAVASNLTDYARADQVQNSSLQWLTSVSGVDTITAAASITPSAYAAGQTWRFVSAGANTGAVTLNVSSLGARSVTKNGTVALAAGDIPSGAVVTVTDDGTRLQLVGIVPDSYTAKLNVAQSWTAKQTFPDTLLEIVDNSDATKKLLFELSSITTGTTRTLTVPDQSGTLTILTAGTPVTLSGTSGDFTGLPSTTKVIVGMLLGASSNAASTFLLQLGDSGGIETSGYTGAATGATDGGTATYTASTSGVALGTTAAAGDTLDAVVIMTNITGNNWLIQGGAWRNGSTDVGWSVIGIKQLSATLDRVRATTAAADTLDAGTFNLFYWG